MAKDKIDKTIKTQNFTVLYTIEETISANPVIALSNYTDLSTTAGTDTNKQVYLGLSVSPRTTAFITSARYIVPDSMLCSTVCSLPLTITNSPNTFFEFGLTAVGSNFTEFSTCTSTYWTGTVNVELSSLYLSGNGTADMWVSGVSAINWTTSIPVCSLTFLTSTINVPVGSRPCGATQCRHRLLGYI